MRETFCESGTADEECIVPILGGVVYQTEEDWCREKYNHSDASICREIRDDAQRKYNAVTFFLFMLNGIWALFLVALIWVMLCVLQAIITLPIVQRSKESNIPLWLTVPILGCVGAGYTLIFTRASIDEQFQDAHWIGIVFLTSGALFALAASLGIVLKFYTVLNGRQRRIKQAIVVLFIAAIFTTIFTMTTIFITSLIYSLQILELPEYDFRSIACALDVSGSCTGCHPQFIPKDSSDICPEWTDDDVQRVLTTIMKQSATIAAIFIVYALISLRYGFVFFQYVSRYQIEYV